MPLIGVNSKHEVDLDVFDAANVAVSLPRELLISFPSRTHTKEGGMRDSLSIGSDVVMLFSCKLNPFGTKAGKDLPDETDALSGGAVIDLDERLAFRVNCWPM